MKNIIKDILSKSGKKLLYPTKTRITENLLMKLLENKKWK